MRRCTTPLCYLSRSRAWSWYLAKVPGRAQPEKASHNPSVMQAITLSIHMSSRSCEPVSCFNPYTSCKSLPSAQQIRNPWRTDSSSPRPQIEPRCTASVDAGRDDGDRAIVVGSGAHHIRSRHTDQCSRRRFHWVAATNRTARCDG